MQSIRLSLVENAESFVAESISKAILAEADPSQWKFAILSLVQALELTLKEMLRREHWTLVFQNVDKPTMTVSFDGALSRLTNIVKVPFAQSDVDAIRTAIALRNQVVHSDVSFEEQQVKVLFTRLLGFAQHCFSTYLDRPLKDFVGDPVWDRTVSLFEFVDELYRRAADRIASDGIADSLLLDCHHCDFENVVVPTGSDSVCYVCGHKRDVTYCATCGCVEYTDEAMPVNDDCDAFCCERCMENGVLVSSQGVRLVRYQEVQGDTEIQENSVSPERREYR